MKFEINVTQSGIIQSLGLSVGTMVAIFKVDATTVSQALVKVVESQEYQNIEGAECCGICVVGEMPTYEIE